MGVSNEQRETVKTIGLMMVRMMVALFQIGEI